MGIPIPIPIVIPVSVAIMVAVTIMVTITVTVVVTVGAVTLEGAEIVAEPPSEVFLIFSAVKVPSRAILVPKIHKIPRINGRRLTYHWGEGWVHLHVVVAFDSVAVDDGHNSVIDPSVEIG